MATTAGGLIAGAGVTLIAVVIIEILKPGAAHGFRPSPFFPGSRLVTPEWGGTLNGWVDEGEGQEWALCCSTFEGCDAAAKFHEGCDAHNTTLTVVHNAGCLVAGSACDPENSGSNPGNFTFGGFVRTLSHA